MYRWQKHEQFPTESFENSASSEIHTFHSQFCLAVPAMRSVLFGQVSPAQAAKEENSFPGRARQ